MLKFELAIDSAERREIRNGNSNYVVETRIVENRNSKLDYLVSFETVLKNLELRGYLRFQLVDFDSARFI